MAGVVVAEARNSLEAVLWVDALKAEGIPATSFERSVAPAMGGVDAFARFPVMVPAELDGSGQPRSDNHSYVIAQAARRIVESDVNMHGIVCFTMSGRTAGLVSKVHPNAPIFAMSPDEAVCRKLALARGVVPILVPLVHSSEEMLQAADRVLTTNGYMREGEEVVVVASLPVQAVGATNFVKLHRVGESSAY